MILHKISMQYLDNIPKTNGNNTFDSDEEVDHGIGGWTENEIYERDPASRWVYVWRQSYPLYLPIVISVEKLLQAQVISQTIPNVTIVQHSHSNAKFVIRLSPLSQAWLSILPSIM